MAAELTRRKRSLGRYMEALRKRMDPPMSAEALADLCEIARTTITRMEGGSQLPNRHLFAAILGALGVNDTERKEAFALWHRAKQPTATVEHASDLAPKYVAFRRDESEAVAELTINYVALPGVLQTARYASAVAEGGRLDVVWEQRMADERLARRQLLEGERPLRLHAILSEAALRYVVGGLHVWKEQLEQLLSATERENITIQVVPFARGAFGHMSGPVIILCFDDDPDAPHIVYLEHPAGGETIDKQEDVASFVAIFEDVRGLAWSPEESADFIRSLLNETKDE
jgi:transcriptional regulator with XRE-family HTH domain